MNKYYYFAVIRFEEVDAQGAGRTKRVPVTHFGKNAYATPEAALDANRMWICKHLGERFTVAGFDRQLKLDENGISHGYIEDESTSRPE